MINISQVALHAFAIPSTSSLGITLSNTYIVSIHLAILWDTERIEENNDCNSSTDPLEFA